MQRRDVSFSICSNGLLSFSVLGQVGRLEYFDGNCLSFHLGGLLYRIIMLLGFGDVDRYHVILFSLMF